ncbi:MAG: hypothetical protein Q4G24_13695 [Paracoccus sp. (in: a-proteobacteria)]|uniref:hypothetical protein n=1 Tax=Paracoccus sp. TaxID=267 RepID=UPI0026E0AC89|nr:hypothetical protein [Paracoccus sp. (in: a-proteobacteria)]MDO5622512.1 hypothetical protein [Paracoccus sp. (in: a-proteobacteria)]
MTRPRFPRPHDDAPHAWGLTGDVPLEVWERFSPAYEAQAERLALALEDRGYRVEFMGAGGQDGEYINVIDASDTYVALIHLEDPEEAQELAAMDDAALLRWIGELAG